jgi:hypothetical protein
LLKKILKSFVSILSHKRTLLLPSGPEKHTFSSKGSTDILKPTALDCHSFENLLNQEAASATRDTGLPSYIWDPESVCRTLRKDIKDIRLETHT